MGQTLTHGIYLPDEGERNCYNGLAANWQILDTSVGTIAAHTAALAGKAPAVHTHTKADITDFPVYGTTAGTICEGNDSRLSDARTPVAHTHGKADITDLFNSANTWSADQTLTSQAYIKSPTWEKGVEPSSATHRNIYFVDKNNAVVGTIRRRIANGSQSFQFFGSALVKNGQLDPTGDNVTWGFSQIFNSDGSTYFQFDGNIGNSIIPRSNNTFDLGSSTLKWKTLNGINPGALSLPDVAKYMDLTSNIPSASLDGIISINLSSYITSNGWLAITVPDTNTDDFVFVQVIGTLANRYFASGARGNGFISLMMPINIAGQVVAQIKASSVSFCRFYPCLGNV